MGLGEGLEGVAESYGWRLEKLTVAMTGVVPGLDYPLVDETIWFPKLEQLATSGFKLHGMVRVGLRGWRGGGPGRLSYGLLRECSGMGGWEEWRKGWEEWDALQWTAGHEVVVSLMVFVTLLLFQVGFLSHRPTNMADRPTSTCHPNLEPYKSEWPPLSLYNVTSTVTEAGLRSEIW